MSLLRLLQLMSPSLPIGMYSYSQGLESAVEHGWINDADSARAWLAAAMRRCQGCVDLPMLSRLYDARQQCDGAAADTWNAHLLASRESAELRAEDRQTGLALARLLAALHIELTAVLDMKKPMSLAYVFSLAAVTYAIAKRDAMIGYLWGWLENQVLCAVKLIPLGQVAGQRLLHELAADIPALVDAALIMTDDQIGGSIFALPLASSRHECQYSRLFRS